jgi:hypothetical protein
MINYPLNKEEEKMPNFTFEIRETLCAIVAVRVADADEARQLVEDDYSAEKIILDSSNIAGDMEIRQIVFSEANPEPDFKINC